MFVALKFRAFEKGKRGVSDATLPHEPQSATTIGCCQADVYMYMMGPNCWQKGEHNWLWVSHFECQVVAWQCSGKVESKIHANLE